ncbi:hypothetical protein SMICM304S_07406 [Streptomyces microflavus]
MHHEREVARADILARRPAPRVRRESGVSVSFHLTGTGADDPYLADITRAIDEVGGRVPSLVNEVRPFGRGHLVGQAARTGPDPSVAAPCSMAAWPVVAFDGTVLACCNQDTVDRRPARPIWTSGTSSDDWGTVRRRALESPVLRMIRTVSRPIWPPTPVPRPPGSYCDGCRALGGDEAVTAAAGAVAAGPAGALLDLAAARRGALGGPEGVVRRHGCSGLRPTGGRRERAVSTGVMGASARLRTKLQLLEPELRGATAYMWRPEGLLPRYRSYLCTMHAVIRPPSR